MARIIIEAAHADGERRRWTLSERIISDDHYTAQLLDRVSWAVADAQALESLTGDIAADDDQGSAPSAENHAGREASDPRSRPDAGERVAGA